MDRPKLINTHADPGIVEDPVGEALSQPLLASVDRGLADRNGTDEGHLYVARAIDQEITRQIRLTKDGDGDAVARRKSIGTHVAHASLGVAGAGRGGGKRGAYARRCGD